MTPNETGAPAAGGGLEGAAPRSFQLALRVGEGDLDERRHVNNVVYLRWVQDVATAHWRAVASAEAQVEVAWVALRHEIDYKAAGVLGDDLVVRTWVGEAEGLTFERHTEVLRAADGRLLARARTLWCPVDARNGRPRRVTAQIRAQFSTAARADPG